MRCQLIQRRDFVSDTPLDDRGRHRRRECRLWILHEDRSTGVSNMLGAQASVLSHSGEHDGQAMPAEDLGRTE